MTLFSNYERMIAWRYLRASRREGGVSVLTWISLIGITLSVAALIAVLAVRSGFRSEFVGTILGANAHVSVYSSTYIDTEGRETRVLSDFDEMAKRLLAVEGVIRAAPIVRTQVLASANGANAGVELIGMRPEDLASLTSISEGKDSIGSLQDFPQGIAIGAGIARHLGVGIGDKLRVLSPNGVKSPLGTSPRASAWPIVYIFKAGRTDIDNTRVYLPFETAQEFLNREGAADEIEVMLADPEGVDAMTQPILAATGENILLWTWKDASGAFLRALTVEDNVMWVVMSILVLIATMNIISGLIMLVKNKGHDIGILRTIGLTQGSVLRIFFLCGALLGVTGTILGVALGCAFAIWIDPIFRFINWIAGGGVWDPEIRGLYSLPAELRAYDVGRAVALSLFLTFVVTIFPARRAARMNPVEALRHE